LIGDFTTLACATVAAETVARLQASSRHSALDGSAVVRLLAMVMMELGVQHLVTTVLGMMALRWKGWYPQAGKDNQRNLDGRQKYFS
jgi:hypothetical protein